MAASLPCTFLCRIFSLLSSQHFCCYICNQVWLCTVKNTQTRKREKQTNLILPCNGSLRGLTAVMHGLTLKLSAKNLLQLSVCKSCKFKKHAKFICLKCMWQKWLLNGKSLDQSGYACQPLTYVLFTITSFSIFLLSFLIFFSINDNHY